MKISDLITEEKRELLERKRNIFGMFDLAYLDDLLLTRAFDMDIKEYALIRLASAATGILDTLQDINAKME